MSNCSVCSKEFICSANTPKKLTCSKECSYIRRSQKSLENYYKKKTTLFNVECNVCSKIFATNYANKKYCSNICGKKKQYTNHSKRYKEELSYKLKDVLRSRIRKAIKNNQKTGSAVSDLGCSIEEFKVYMESKFKDGMNWNNWSKDGWHIDHIKPLDSFDLTNEQEFKEACHYSNLQPMWAKENLSKGNKIEN